LSASDFNPLPFYRRGQSFRHHRPTRPAARSRKRRLAVEWLEPRRVLTAGPTAGFHPTYFIEPTGNGAAPFASSTPSGLTPTQIRHAYGFDQIAFGGVQGDGSGQTIAIIDPYDSPTIVSDLHAFDLQFGLPDPPSFVRVAQDGSTNYPMTDPNGPGHPPITWEVETALDVEWAHALAPMASLLLVEANGTQASDLLTAAVGYARSQPGVSVVTMSFGQSETPSELTYDSLFTTPSGHQGVTFVAGTGDSGQPGAYPAYSPNVVAVGGTALSVDATGNYQSESGWSGSGGGISSAEQQPSYQSGVVTQSTAKRTTPDVAFDAGSGVPVYDSWDFGSSTPWVQIGGTSLSSPSWAALIAVANQARVAAGMTTLDGPTQTLPKLYTMPSSDFNDVMTGNNGFAAGPGYDLVTGRGSPKATSVVSDLVGAVASSTPAAGSAVSTPPTDFAVTFASAYSPGSIQAGDLAVNAIAADSFTLTSSTTVTFHYNASPVTTQGLQSMSIPAGAVTWQSNGAPLAAFNASFRYDVLPITVSSMTPASGSTLTLPLASLSVHFNEAYSAASIGTSDLSLSQGTVSGFMLVDSQTVRYSLAGITAAGTLTINMAAGAVTDPFGNPGPAFSGSLVLNYAATPFPTPLARVAPVGSLIYQSSTSGTIGAGSTDSYSLSLAGGQTISILVTSASGLQPQLNLTGPGVSASASSPAGGAPAVLQTIAINTIGQYAFSVSGLNATTGSYTIQVELNAALSSATVGGAGNHSLATAQTLDPSFVTLAGVAQRGAVTGTIANLAGPDGFGYAAAALAPQFDDISPTGASPTPNAPILVGVDDGFVQLTPTNLGGFQFTFYNSTYSSVYVSSNGLLTFGSGNSVYRNTDLTSDPSQATIAPLWDDLYVSGAAQSGVYWQVQGTGASQRLVVQFNDVSFVNSASYTGPLTFEAILNADGTIIFNYKNLNSGDSNAGGAHAVVGIKDAGAQGSDRLLISYRSSSSPYVGSGRSLEIGTGLSSFLSDYYAYTLAAGQTTALAVTGQTSATVSVALEDAQGHTLAAGAWPGSGSNVTAAIQNFIAPTAGTYYAVVTGASGAAYSLVANRSAAFDTEINSGFVTAQDISGTQGVLGFILAPPATPTENWYSLNLAAGNELLLQTSTPGGNGAQFANGLSPEIELYSPSDALVATGKGAADQSLSALAAVSGAYRIRVWGNNSTSGEYFLSTVIDAAPPIATITPVAPNPRNAPVGQIQIVFNEPVSGVTLGSFSLTANGGPNLLTASQSLTTSDYMTYTLGNLAPLTNTEAAYTLTLAASQNILDSTGGYLASGATAAFVVDMTPPTVAITPVNPNPSTAPIGQMQIVFSEPVTSVRLAALSLSHNNGPNLLTSAQTLTTSDNRTFTLGNLGGITNVPGAYVLDLNANGSGISDAAGNALSISAGVNFVVNVPAKVTIASDSGLGTLRQALLDSAGAPGLTHTIEFELADGAQTIDLLSPLPALADPLIAVLDSTQNVTIKATPADAWDDYRALTKSGDGKLTLADASVFGGDMTVTAGFFILQDPVTPTFALGVGASIFGSGSLELAGTASQLTREVNVSNDSTAIAGVLVSGVNQVVGAVIGSGTLRVASGGELTAIRIQQSALVIGGTATSSAILTIAASDASGQALFLTTPASHANTFVVHSSDLLMQPTGSYMSGLVGGRLVNVTPSSEAAVSTAPILSRPSAAATFVAIAVDASIAGVHGTPFLELVRRSTRQPAAQPAAQGNVNRSLFYAFAPRESLAARVAARETHLSPRHAIPKASGMQLHDLALEELARESWSPRVASILRR
jgi:autotransporter-associated beta strand protein